LQELEFYLLNVASRCEINIGFNGAAGFVYQSVKDQLKWNNLSVKKYIGLIMQIGYYATLKKEDFDKIGGIQKKVSEMSEDQINTLAGV